MLMHRMRLALPAQIVLALSLRCQSSTRAANGGAPARAANDAAPAVSASVASPTSPREALIARAKSLELDTVYVPPPGDPLSHHTAGFAKVMCSAVFVTGLDPDFPPQRMDGREGAVSPHPPPNRIPEAPARRAGDCANMAAWPIRALGSPPPQVTSSTSPS